MMIEWSCCWIMIILSMLFVGFPMGILFERSRKEEKKDDHLVNFKVDPELKKEAKKDD